MSIIPEVGMKGYVETESGYQPITIIHVSSNKQSVLVKFNHVRYIKHYKVNIVNKFDFKFYNEDDYEINEKDDCKFAIMKNEYENFINDTRFYWINGKWLDINKNQLILNEWKYWYYYY